MPSGECHGRSRTSESKARQTACASQGTPRGPRASEEGMIPDEVVDRLREHYHNELDKKDAEIERLTAALKPFAELADRKEYTLYDVRHGLMIGAKLALRGMRVVNGLVEQSTRE